MMSLFSELLSKSADLETQKKLALLKEGAMKQKFQNAVDTATEAFWAAVAKEFSEIKTGDVDPAEDDAFNTAAEKAVMHWYETNGGSAE